MLGLFVAVAMSPQRYAAAFPISSDGTEYIKWIPASPDLDLIETKSGRVKFHLVGCKFSPNNVLFSPNGMTLAAGSALGELCLWSTETGRMITRVEDADVGHLSALWISLAYSPDSRTLAVGNLMFSKRSQSAVEPGIVTLWDPDKGVQRLTVRVPSAMIVREIRFLRGGKSFRTLTSPLADFDTQTGRPVGDGLPINSDAISDDGSLVYAYSPGWITVWNANKRKLAIRVKDLNPIPAARVIFAPNNRSLVVLRERQVTNGDTGYTVRTIELRSYPDGKVLWIKEGITTGDTVCFSPDSQTIQLSNGEIRDAATGTVVSRLKPTEMPVLERNGRSFLLPRV